MGITLVPLLLTIYMHSFQAATRTGRKGIHSINGYNGQQPQTRYRHISVTVTTFCHSNNAVVAAFTGMTTLLIR